MNKELLQQKAEASWEEVTNHFKEGVNPSAYTLGFNAGAKEILDNPELYELVQKDLLDEVNSAWIIKMVECNEECERCSKENKELKEKITQLETVINKLSHKIILYESNY